MASSLLDRSLDDISRDNTSRRGSGRPLRGRASSDRRSNGAGAPYSKPVPRGDADGAWSHDLFQTDKLNYGDDDHGNGPAAAPSRAGNPRRRGGDTNEARSTRLRITNLHYEVSETELEALFKQVGALAPGTARETNPAIKDYPSETSKKQTITHAEYEAYDHAAFFLDLFNCEAFVTYESESDAARALEVFNNALAKGERISLEYDFRGPPRPRRIDGGDGSWKTGIPVTGSSRGGGAGGNSLLSRMEKSANDNAPGGFTSSIGRAPIPQAGRGSPRGAPRSSVPRGGSRGSGPTRGGRGGGRSERGSERSAAKTAEDLDRELEEFMAKGSGDAAPAAASTSAAANTGGEDVEMS